VIETIIDATINDVARTNGWTFPTVSTFRVMHSP
jgi:hypothetical protein